MQFRHPESYQILSDGRILQDPMGSGVGYVDLGGRFKQLTTFTVQINRIHHWLSRSYNMVSLYSVLLSFSH